MTLKEFNDLYLEKAVHCETEELANEFLELADSLGCIWNRGDKLTKFNEWDRHKDKTYYRVYDGKHVVYGHIDDTNLKIIKFKGEQKMTLKDLKQGMVCELRNSEVITVLDGGSYYNSNYKDRPYLFDRYNDDLTSKEEKDYDIIKITYGDKVVFERKVSSWFVPELDESYFFKNSFGMVSSMINNQFSTDINIFNSQRVFKTYEEAKKRLKQQQATLSVERWIAENDVEVDVCNTNVLKWIIVYDYDVDIKRFKTISTYFYVYTPKQFILSSEEKAKQLIKEREKELKIMFGVEE